MWNKVCFIALFLLLGSATTAQTVRIGSKTFPESRLLGEIMAQLIHEKTGYDIDRKFGLGGSLICLKALETGEIDLYPEYTGTLMATVLSQSGAEAFDDQALRDAGYHAGPRFGFNNTYVLVTRPETGLEKISDLRGRMDLKYGFSTEFLHREDGFEGMNEFYGLGLSAARGMEHGLAYRALSNDRIDVTDAYSTDGKLPTYDFVLLEDDRGFFPPYLALPLMRTGYADQHPRVMEALQLLKGQLDEETMRRLNHEVEVERRPSREVAAEFLYEMELVEADAPPAATHPLWTQTIEHLQLTLVSTLIAILLAIPLGVFIAYKPRWSRPVLSTTGVLQTIPSLALLGFMIPLFGIGFVPAIIALFLYALLPIVRNTYTGLKSTDPLLMEAARAIGMSRRRILLQIQLPLAAEVIMAGVRTALTINIGTATLAAFIGAGGYGDSIISGITLNDNSLIMRGAVPAALLALIADWLMSRLEKVVRPKGLEISQ